MAEQGFKWRVTDFRTLPSIATDRRGLLDAMITYELTGVGIDTVTMPSEDATPDAVKAKVEEAVRKKLEFIGMSGEVAR